MRRYRKTFECIRCEGLVLKTGAQMISHFRLIHLIKPETFCPEKRQAFYETFKMGYREYCKDTDEETGETDSEGGDPPSPALDSFHRRYNSLTPNGIPEAIEFDQSTKPVRDMTDSPVVTESNETENTQIDIITSQGTGPEYCPECGKGVGYSIHSFKSHCRVSRGLCKSTNAGKQFHRCLYCKTDFSKYSSLRDHNARFGEKCKAWQLSLNRTDVVDNFNGGAREPIRSAAGVSLKRNERQSLFDNLKADQVDGPYYCPHCGRGVGCSFARLKTHITHHNGKCREAYAKKKFYSCQLCYADFLDLYRVRYHNVKFGNSCREWEKGFYPERKKARYDTFSYEDTDSDGCGRESPSPPHDSTHTTDIPMRNDRVHTNAIIVKREQSTDVTKSNSTSNTMHSPNDLIIDGDKAPYYCPDCGIGLGYSFSSYKHHIGIQKGLCRNNAGRPLYGCKICKQEFLQISSLKRHYESYGNSCKAKQISINRERYNLCVRVLQREQSMDVTEYNSTSDNAIYSPNDLIIDEDKAPYYCPDCGIGLGYSFISYSHHIRTRKGLCRNTAGRPLYGCKICKQEFLQISSLKRHYESYGNSCKAKQISINRERYNLCVRIPQREQSMDVTESNSTSDNTMHSPNDLIIRTQKGLCRNNAGKPLYGCKICKREFLDLSNLRRHNKSFGNSCKAKQISINRERYNLLQSMENTISMSTRDSTNELVAKQDSIPYYCPDCGRGTGFASCDLRVHKMKYKGCCKKKFDGRSLHTCEYCTKEFVDLSSLRSHCKLFGDTCKAKQISSNSKK